MSDNGEIFRYKKHGGKFLKMRKEFLEICEYDVINALILRVFENELEQKRAAYEATNAQRQVRGQQPQRPNFWIEMPWARLIHKLHMDGNMSENTIKAHMRSVLAKTFLIQRKNPKDPNRKPYQYMLNVDAIQNAIDHLGDEPFLDDASYLASTEEVQSQVSASDPSTIDTSNFDPSTPSQELIPSHQDLTPGSRSVGYQDLTPLIDNIDSQNKEIIIDESNSDDTTKPPVVSSDTARADTLQDEQLFTDEKPQGDDHATRVPPLPAANCVAHSERTSPRHAQDNSDGASLPADGLPVVRVVGSGTPGQEAGRDTRDTGRDRTAQVAEKGQTNDGNQSRASSRHPDSSGQPMRVSGNSGNCDLGTTYQETLAETPTTSTPAQSLSLPQAEQAALGQSPKGKGKKQAEPKPETPKSPPVEPPADMAWGTRKCLMWFDFWRGGILIGKWKLMQASTCAKGLAEQFDEQTVIQARNDMEADPYYADKGGCDVCDVANNIHKYLKRRQGKQKPAIQPTLKVVKRYSSYDDPNFRSDQDFYPVEGGSYATASR